MKKILLFILIAVTMVLFPKANFGQAPDLGAASSFTLFTAGGAFNSTGASVVTGDVGTHVGAFNAFPPGTLIGAQHVADATSGLAATALAAAYLAMSGLGGIVIPVGLGNGQTLAAGTYQTGAASTLNGNLILDGGNNPNALFIIRIGGAFATGASSTVTLINSASLCNVYWQIGGQFDLGDGSVFRGTAIVDGAINLLGSATFFGRGLSTAGAVTINSNVVSIVIPPETPKVTVTQPTCTVATGTITVTSPLGSGMFYSIDGTDYTNTTGIFTVNPGSYIVTAKNSEGCVSPGAPSSGTPVIIDAQPVSPAAPTAVITQPTCVVATGSVVLNGLPAGNWTTKLPSPKRRRV